MHDEVDLFGFRATQDALQPPRRPVPVSVTVMKVGKHTEFDAIHFSFFPVPNFVKTLITRVTALSAFHLSGSA